MNPLKRFIFAVSALAIVLIGTGCGSPVPIQDTSEAVFMPELVGTWQTMPEPGSPPDELIVVNFNDTEYYVELREHAEGWSEGDTLRLRAYITHVNGQAFINAQYIGSMKPDDRVFFFNTVTLNPDGTLTLTELNELDEMGPDDFETSEALYAFIRRNLHNQDLYGASITLRRISG